MSAFREVYATAYASLNEGQKRAVDTTEGPVMVIAGPGTGKTQVLSLRIANILTKTDTPPDGVLCLTFTNAGVSAMRERLMRYMGPSALRVKVATFHSFALGIIEEFYPLTGHEVQPTLLEDQSSVALFDELLYLRDWKYLRPRTNPALYFRDLKSLISTLKRDAITPEEFMQSIAKYIDHLRTDPASISSRGETKGQLKKEIEKKIESLARTLEAAEFYALYQEVKQERGLIDYNDALDMLVGLVTSFEEVQASIRERYLYVLVDEHQDSSGVQNAFLKAVWGEVELPNIFVVGDDRQLIYGFGGASLSHFQAFETFFPGVTRITLTENYRSTQTVLDMAETLLSSGMADGVLKGNTTETYPLRLVEADYPRDEILLAGLSMKEHIGTGADPSECALLVPKNRHVKNAIQVLRDLGIPVASDAGRMLFEVPEAQSFLTFLRITANPFDGVALSRSVLDSLSHIPALEAHRFLSTHKHITLDTLLEHSHEAIARWGTTLSSWLTKAQTLDAYALIQHIAEECFLSAEAGDETVRNRVEIVRTLLHIALSQSARGSRVSVADFLSFIDRLESYGEDIPLAVFGAGHGVRVLTLHGSKGLEFDMVWIAHMDERSFGGSKRQAFALPEALSKEEERYDESVKKRELYVALTRAKRFCTISYARYSYSGSEQVLAQTVAALPRDLFETMTAEAAESHILNHAPTVYTARASVVPDASAKKMLEAVVQEEYTKRKVSVTMLNNFFECPWKWYFRNLLQLPEPENESLHVGTVVHAAIEFALKHPGEESATQLRQAIEESALREARYDNAHAARLVAAALPIVQTWVARTLPTIIEPYSTERAISYTDPEVPHLALFGKIDLIETLPNGSVRVTDWKTGSTKTNSEIEKTDEEGRLSSYLRQLAMYSYLLEGSSLGAQSVAESRLVFLEARDGDKQDVVARTITQREVGLLRTDILDYDQLVKTGGWMERQCSAPLARAGDVCQYCEMARKYGVL